MKRIPAVTYLKLLATVMVFVRHALIVSVDSYNVVLRHPAQMVFVMPAWSGVWIFFTVSGFLTGRTLLKQRKFSLTRKGWWLFIRQRGISLLVPAFCFIFTAQLFVTPDVLFRPNVWLRFITLTFNGGTGVGHGVGLVWYVFILMWLYFLSFPVCMLLDHLEKRFQNQEHAWIILFIGVVLFGVFYRCIAGVFLKLDWYNFLYANPIANIDLFFGGLLTNKIGQFPSRQSQGKRWNRTKMVIGAGTALFLANCALSYYAEIGVSIASRVYRYVFPTVILLFTAWVLFAFGRGSSVEKKLHPFISFLDRQQFSFYLWHSVVMYCLSKRINFENPWLSHAALIVAGCFVTLAIACLFTNAVKPIIVSLQTKKH